VLWTCIFSSSLLLLIPAHVALAQVVINEIADKGTGNACSGEDWIELYNRGDTEVSLAGYILHDDQGPEDSDAFVFHNDASGSAATSIIPPKTFLVLCCNGDGISSPAFKIGGVDSIVLRDGSSGAEIDSSGILPDAGEFDRTYARNNAMMEGELVQTATPTPGSENVITVPPTSTREKDYHEQNALGSAFFGMGDGGDRVSDSFDDVIDLYAQVDESEWDYLRSNPYAETYISVNEFKVVSSDESYVLSSPGRMRPRGQLTLFMPICLDLEDIPFKLDFASVNATQTLFGMETAYLRNHLMDESHMKEWVMHRMLARFGLPYLRTRHVRFHVNGAQLGFYTFMEAPDQEYVMSRNFGYTYDKASSALYKVKTFSLRCGDEEEYVENNEGFPEKCTSAGNDCCADESLGEAKTCEPGYYVKDLPDFCMYTCMSESSDTYTGPYSFERGDHRDKVAIKYDFQNCFTDFIENYFSDRRSVVRAFFDAGFESANDCGAFLLDKNIIDRDIGSKDFDAPMKNFIDSHIGVAGECQDKQCSSKTQIRDEIDVDNWLKNFAVYAVVVVPDSPMGNGNNYFLAAAGDSTIDSPEWKLQPYDHNNDHSLLGLTCNATCFGKDLTELSVIRPTCTGLSENSIVGPLLLDPELHARYLKFVREFVLNVYTNETLWEEMKEHSEAIGSVANNSPSDLFKWMKTRSIKVLQQLSLWDNDVFPKDASIDSTEACATVVCDNCCIDDVNYSFTSGKGKPKKCNWVAKTQERKDKWCPRFREGQGVKNACRLSCNNCCQDDASYTFQINEGGSDFGCSWVGKTSIRQEKFCKTIRAGQIVENACPVACNNCPGVSEPPTANPTASPSDGVSEPPTANPTAKPPTANPTASPSDDVPQKEVTPKKKVKKVELKKKKKGAKKEAAAVKEKKVEKSTKKTV